MSRFPIVTWGRGPALLAMTESMTAAGVGVREVWCEEDLATLTDGAALDLKPIAPGASWHGGVHRMDAALGRLHDLPDIALVAEVFLSLRIADQVLAHAPVMNIHPAPLPRYRGAHPLPWQIILGETSSAVTFHLVTSEIDAGPILQASSFSIERSDNYGQVLRRVLDLIRRDSGTVARGYLEGAIQPREQEHALATYVVKRSPSDGQIDWDASAEEIRNTVRALTDPLPGAWTLWNGRRVILDEVVVDGRFSAYVGRTTGQVARLGNVLGILARDAAVVPLRLRDAATGQDVTRDVRVNDRFGRELS